MLELVLELVLESPDSSPKSAESDPDSVIDGQRPILNIFHILLTIQSANGNWPMLAVGLLKNWPS